MKKIISITAIICLFSFPALGDIYKTAVTVDYGDGTSATYDGPDMISSTQEIGGNIVTYYYDKPSQ